MIAAAKTLASDFNFGRCPWEVHLSKAEGVPEFQRPGPETDVLYDDQVPSQQIPHPKDPWRERHPTNPRVYLALIGSANTLLKDVALRNELRDRHGVQAIEMEGSGTADAAWSAGRDY